MATLKESRLDQVESLLASVYKREEPDCIFQLCGLQKIQVESCQVQISMVFLHTHVTGTPHPHWLELDVPLCMSHDSMRTMPGMPVSV